MRQILEVLKEANHPVMIVTKSAMVTRDIDLLAPMAEKGLARVGISVTTLDRKLARSMEPRASTPTKRLEALRAISEAGIPAGVLVAPIIPALNDHEIERVLDSAKSAGASDASYVLLRLPLEVSPCFVTGFSETTRTATGTSCRSSAPCAAARITMPSSVNE